MEKNQETKKFFCARCFLPIDSEDKVDVEGQNFHRICSMCCICRMIPTSLKMFYGHVFCSKCFNNHIITRSKGENPCVQSNSWWMQWAPGSSYQEKDVKTEDNIRNTEDAKSENSTEPNKRLICARCLQPVTENQKVTIGDQNFHSQCGQCYVCKKTPTNNLKIYYGQVFCEECFHSHVLNRNKDNPSEFFKNCFAHWQNNTQFSDNMRDFMGGNKETSPFIFMMQSQQPPFCRCGTGPQEWFQPNEPKKCKPQVSKCLNLNIGKIFTAATPAICYNEDESCDLSFEDRTEITSVPNSGLDESANIQFAAEKIENLTKYLHIMSGTEQSSTENWKILEQNPLPSDPLHGWIDIQSKKKNKSYDCPKCLWQSGPIYVDNEILRDMLNTGN